jgi:hypothetical protein
MLANFKQSNISFYIRMTWQQGNNGFPLLWCRIDLVELQRLKLSFSAKLDADGVTRLYSLDYSDLYISNKRDVRTNELMEGLPHSLLLSNRNEEAQILVPAWNPHRVWWLSSTT